MIVLIAASLLGTLELIGLIIVAIIALGVVVFAHEWGHFMAGRRAGIRAEAFSIGFGPILWRKTIGETEYRISAILFGGYVKFTGMEGTPEKTPQQIERGFYAAAPGRRIFTAFAGPFMNLVLAFALFFVLWGTGRKVPEHEATTVIGGLLEDSPAEKAGLQLGDRIVSIDGRKVGKWMDVLLGIRLGGKTLDIEFERHGRMMRLNVVPDTDPDRKVPVIGVERRYQVVVREVTKGSEAERMGLRTGDLMLALDGERVHNATSWHRALPKKAGQPITITVERDGRQAVLTGTMPAGQDGKRPVLGFLPAPAPVFVTINEDPLEAVAYCFDLVGRTLKGLVTRQVKAKELAGPVGIVTAIVMRLSVSFTSFLWLAAFISLNLAVVNLLPIPVVDGGHIMFSVIEKVRRKPVREKTMALVTNVFAVLIIAFFLYITFHDVKRFIPSSAKDDAKNKKTPVERPEPGPPEPEAPQPETPPQ